MHDTTDLFILKSSTSFTLRFGFEHAFFTTIWYIVQLHNLSLEIDGSFNTCTCTVLCS